MSSNEQQQQQTEATTSMAKPAKYYKNALSLTYQNPANDVTICHLIEEPTYDQYKVRSLNLTSGDG